MNAKQHVLIIGGGFGGVKAALEILKQDRYRVTLITDREDFEYHPTLYKVATGRSRVLSKIPLAEVFKEKRIRIIVDTAVTLDRKTKTVTTQKGGVYRYNIVILALGMVTNYFGIEGLDTYSFGIKSLADAEKLKRHLHEQLTNKQTSAEHCVVVGGGPTGIELSCELPEYIRHIEEQHGLSTRSKVHVDLIEAAPRLLPRMHPGISRSVARRLRHSGVRLHLNKPVQAETADTLLVGGKPIRAHTVIWTAGMANNPFFKQNHFILSQNGKVQVDKYLQAWPGIFVIGDSADTKFSGMAQTALHHALFVANNLKRHAEKKRALAYTPKDPVYIIPAGKHWAALSYKKFYVKGWMGWLLRKTADWIGYKDIEPWWRATGRMMGDMKQEDTCLICAAKAPNR